ncbi:MAG: hypothetical protein MHPSP_000375 [Paramarteilia canceri]
MGLFGSSALSMQRKNLPQRLIFRSPTLNNRNYSVKDTKYTEKDNTNKETPAKQIHSVDYQNNTNNNLHSYKNKFGNYCEGKTQHTTQLLDDFVFGPDAWTGPIRTELNDGKIFYFRADGTWSQGGRMGSYGGKLRTLKSKF